MPTTRRTRSAAEVIRWVDNLPQSTQRGRPNNIEPVIVQLQQEPGRWALVREGIKKDNASRVVQAFRKRGAQAAQRKQADGTLKVYARWPEAPPTP